MYPISRQRSCTASLHDGEQWKGPNCEGSSGSRARAYQSNRSFNIHPPPPPRAFDLWRVGLLNFLPSGQNKPFKKSRSNAPPISTEIPLLKGKFTRLQSNTLHAFQREICRNDTLKLLLKTLLKELFTNKGEMNE